MKKYLTLAFILFVCTELIGQTTYYIDPAGSDDTGDGSSGNPWASLDYACDQVTTAGDTIFVNAGQYNEPNRCDLRVGVSIKGEGDGSHIIFSYNNSWYSAISLHSASAGTNGNQSISYIKLDGNNLTSHGGIWVYQRSNVEIHHCTLVDFNHWGINVRGSYIGSKTPAMGGWDIGTPPSTYETGNKIYDCTITNCHGSRTDGGSGNIQFACQEGFRIYNNTIDQTARADGHNGDCIQFWGSHNKDIKIYNNEFFKPLIQTTYPWNIHIEGGTTYGGIEIYNNVFHNGSCGVNVASFGNYKNAYDYAWDIHHNQFLQDYPVASTDIDYTPYAMIAESYCEYVHFHHNYVKYFAWGASYSSNHIGINNCNVYSNVFESCGFTDSYWSFIITVWATGSAETGESDVVVENVNVYNNSVLRSLSKGSIILANGDGTVSNGITRYINLKNNIFSTDVTDVGYGWAYIVNETERMTDITIYNNVIYGNVNSNDPSYYGSSVEPSNYDEQNTTKSDPLFVGGSPYSFNIQPTSPAINAGIDVGLTTDYADNPIVGLPDIGAYEYQPPSGILIDSDGNIMIDSNGNIMRTE